MKERTHALRTHDADARNREAQPVSMDELFRTPGQPLDRPTRTFFEARFGQDLSRVRVHRDAGSMETAARIGARAFTAGNHIALGTTDRALLAHELAHVVQQRNAIAGPASRVEVGRPGDAFERHADAAASAVMSNQPAPPPPHASTPRLQGSWLSTLLDFTIFLPIGIYRLLGGEYYWASTLKEYMAGLEKNKETEGAYDSDNKARACIKREKELGPSYSPDLREMLIRELLGGWTSNSDEKAILTLLRNHRNDIQDIVKRIGRARIWEDFSGDNLLVLKALTGTAADAGDALVDELRTKDNDQIQLFLKNTDVPELQEVARRALAFKRMTAPVPSKATRSGDNATFTINGIEVTVTPDEIDPKLHGGGHTEARMHWNAPTKVPPPGADPATTPAGPFNPPHITLTITTFYPPEGSQGKERYGRGTVTGDPKNTLEYHESGHGKDWIDYITLKAPPVFGGLETMTITDFQAESTRWNDAMEKYYRAGTKNTVAKTDCVGELARDDELEGTGFTCRTALAEDPP